MRLTVSALAQSGIVFLFNASHGESCWKKNKIHYKNQVK